MSEKAQILSDNDLDIIFRDARTYNAWQDKKVSETLIKAVYDLMKMGPTSANCCPARIKFLTSDEAKQRLKPHLMEGNVEKTMAAPVVAIIGNDMEFYEKLPQLFPHTDAKSWFTGNEEFAKKTSLVNGTLQAGYLFIAARSLGLDCGPMTGFNNKGVDEEFFKDTTIKSNIICNIGYGSPENLFPRSPRLSFDEACEIL
jgi:3-hydroxypropanoate dehydrogenase